MNAGFLNHQPDDNNRKLSNNPPPKKSCICTPFETQNFRGKKGHPKTYGQLCLRGVGISDTRSPPTGLKRKMCRNHSLFLTTPDVRPSRSHLYLQSVSTLILGKKTHLALKYCTIFFEVFVFKNSHFLLKGLEEIYQ